MKKNEVISLIRHLIQIYLKNNSRAKYQIIKNSFKRYSGDLSEADQKKIEWLLKHVITPFEEDEVAFMGSCLDAEVGYYDEKGFFTVKNEECMKIIIERRDAKVQKIMAAIDEYFDVNIEGA